MKEEIFNLNKENKLVQKPEMKFPASIEFVNKPFGLEKYDAACAKYKEHIRSLKHYDISGIVPESWEGKDLVEGKDFEIEKGSCSAISSFTDDIHTKVTSWEFAVPIVQPIQEVKPFDYDLMDKQIKEMFPMPKLSKWKQDYNAAIRADITLPQYQKRFGEWMDNWIENNVQEVEVNNEDDAFEDFVGEIVRYYNGTDEPHIRFADVEIYIPDIIKELKQSFIIKRKI